MEDTVVMYPSMGMSHLVPMVELAKLILTHHRSSISITILVTPQPPTSTSTSTTTTADTTYIQQISTTLPPNMTFHQLPNPSSPRAHLSTHDLAQLRLTLESHSISSIKALVIDFFKTRSLEVSKPLNIPTFCFFPSGASPLAALLYFPTIHETVSGNLKDLDVSINIPGLPPVPASHLPLPMLDRSRNAYEHMLYVASKLPECSGIIRNTFDAFEERAIKAIRNGDCLPDYSRVANATPPLFCLGPLPNSVVAAKGPGGDGGDQNRHFSMEWLDSQSSKSVVFLCFGTVVPFTAEQLREIAVALDRIVGDGGTLCKFLWVIRLPLDCSSMEEILPQGFLDRTKDKGLVVTSWVPQAEILRHDSVGGFVNHCGWNSVLEAVYAGVPMVVMPSNNAENKLNRLFLVEEVKLASRLSESGDGFVSADELERGVKEIMSPEIQSGLRERIGAMSECAKLAWQENGSSRLALTNLVELWKSK